MGIFISINKTIECVVTALCFGILLTASSLKQLGVLQSAGYSGKKYLGWVRKKDNLIVTRYSLLCVMCLLISAVISLCFFFLSDWSAIISLVAYPIFFTVYLIADKKVALRSEITFTPRLKRLVSLLFFNFSVVSYIILTLLNFVDYLWKNTIFSCLKYSALAFLVLLIIPIIVTTNFFIKAYEIPHNNKFIKQAKEKLKNSDIKIVGITGSYAKTSVKFILNTILSSKYKVLTTPRSHNTPIGIALAVNSVNIDDYDIFIAEMGARHLGDIKELCTIAPPDISIITGICNQHTQSFLTFQNIVKAKGEILESTKDKAILADDCYDLFGDYSINKLRMNNVDNIVCSSVGTSFTLTLGGKSAKVTTKLLGAHSAYNIGLAATCAYELGMTLEEIVLSCKDIDYIEHRLQLITSNGVNVLDDGYNSNVKGARAALEVLKLFEGRKVIITPGLVELGVLEYDENFALGKDLVDLDYVILVGETSVQAIKDGYLKSNGDKEKIKVFRNLFEAKEFLTTFVNKGDTILFLNDLPDIY